MSGRTILLASFGAWALSIGAGIPSACGRMAAESVSTPQAVSQALPSPAAGSRACCGQPCITYRHCGRSICCDCKPSVDLVLKVKSPCSDCEVDVPVCLPACCTGEPKVCCGVGFLGRPVVEYQWCCGFSVRVAFKRCGDLLVTTRGH
jgi:hypothetical protein